MSQQFEEANEHDGLSGKNLSGNHQQPSGIQGHRFNLSSKSRLFQRLMTTAHGREARQFFQSQAFAVNEKWRSAETNVPSVWKREVPVPSDSLRVRKIRTLTQSVQAKESCPFRPPDVHTLKSFSSLDLLAVSEF
jgi:hypothetical protein